MRRQFVRTATHAAIAMAALLLLADCSGGGSAAIPPKLMSLRGGPHTLLVRAPSVFDPADRLNGDAHTGLHFVDFYQCPARGPIKYVSDFNNSVINVYAGKFAGQAPCGQITRGVSYPVGLFVQASTHDLYVANEGGYAIIMFHRGARNSFNSYFDSTGQNPVDVTVTRDGTVIASNITQLGGPGTGSISTWIEGPHGGTFVGNFPMTNSYRGGFITVQRSGTVYYNDIDATTGRGALWSLSCPAGACGAQTQVAGVSFAGVGGMEFDADDDLLANDRAGSAETFELPNPIPSTFPLVGRPLVVSRPEGMAINKLDHHWFIADAINNLAVEYSYPDGKLIGTVPGNPRGRFIGIAVDPGDILK